VQKVGSTTVTQALLGAFREEPRLRQELSLLEGLRILHLLWDSGVTLDVAGTPLFVAGCDDPQYMRHDDGPFLRRSVARALRGRPL
jgi:hypothetical protein